jgi:diguanylate cyclase (GGDEF)-like protein/PAS domain S-box-containing protein
MKVSLYNFSSQASGLRKQVWWWTGTILICTCAFGTTALWLSWQDQRQQQVIQDARKIDAMLLSISAGMDTVETMRQRYAASPDAAAAVALARATQDAARSVAVLRLQRGDMPEESALLYQLVESLQPGGERAGDAAAPLPSLVGAGLGWRVRAYEVMNRIRAFENAARDQRYRQTRPVKWLAFGGVGALSLVFVLLAWFGGRLLRARLREHELVELTQQRYRQLFDSAINGMAMVGADGRVLMANLSYARMLGYTPRELAGIDFLSLKHPDDRGDAALAVARVRATNQSTGGRERRYLHRDGSIVWVRSSISILPGEAAGAAQVLVVAEDITAEKIREDRLRRSESLVRNAGLMAGVGGWYLGLSPLRLELSGCLQEWLGMADAPPLRIAALGGVFPRPARRRVLGALRACRRSGSSFDIEVELHAPDGMAHTIRLIGQAVERKGQLSAIEGAWHDLTDIRRGEDALRHSELRFRAIARVTNDAFWEWDAASGTIWRSADLAQRLHLDLRGSRPHDAFWFDMIHPDEQAQVRATFNRALQDGATEWSAEYRYRRADGSYGHLADRATIVRDAGGQVLRVVGGMLEVSERKRVQQALMQMAASVPAGSPATFFDMLLRNLMGAVGAVGGCIARIQSDDRDCAQTIAVVANGVSLANFRYVLADTPCTRLLDERNCMLTAGLQQYPAIGPFGELAAQAFAGEALTDSSGNVIGMIFVLFGQPLDDMTLTRSALRVFAARASAEIERMDIHLQLREQAALLDHAQEAIVALDLGLKVRIWNPGAERVYRLPFAAVRGTSVHGQYADPAALAAALAGVLDKGEWSGEFNQVRASGEQFVAEERWSLVRDDTGAPHSILRIGNDVSERKTREEHIRHLAYYDNLTGLPNRRLFLDRLKQAQARALRYERLGALLFLDMDKFKGLNDTHGHHAGDQFLCCTAQRLCGCVRTADTVARLGGDEFVVVLEDLDPRIDVARAQAMMVAEQLLAQLGEPMELDRVTWRSSVSIGVALFGPEQVARELLLQRADRAMYAAKGAGRNAVRFAEDDCEEQASGT